MVTNRLIERLRDKQATIGIVGLGYVGLPLVLRYSEVGFHVIGFDVDQRKIDKLSRGES
jgi:UDP-N-acetyl-D-glucosamine dehydrogenase